VQIQHIRHLNLKILRFRLIIEKAWRKES
jgi:hypothetical protein